MTSGAVTSDLVARDLVARDLVARDMVASDMVTSDLVLRDIVASDMVTGDMVTGDLMPPLPNTVGLPSTRRPVGSLDWLRRGERVLLTWAWPADSMVRPGKSGGRYVCELVVSLPESSAL
jgi:hypothetical protein